MPNSRAHHGAGRATYPSGPKASVHASVGSDVFWRPFGLTDEELDYEVNMQEEPGADEELQET